MTLVLNHVIVPDGASSTPVLLVLHGILGSGSNWMTFARRLTERRPDWQVVLVDLREHGRSIGQPPPHTVGRAAEDLLALEGHLHGPVHAVSGHSFGSKVATLYSGLRSRLGRPLEQLWLLDGDPGPHRPKTESLRGDDVDRVLTALAALPEEFTTRDEFITQLVEFGLQRPIAAWLGTNLRHVDAHYRFRLDLTAIQDLLDDYRATDAWATLEENPCDTHCVLGGRSPVVPESSKSRFERSTTVHVLPDAGHWVHVDNLPGLLELFVEHLPST